MTDTNNFFGDCIARDIQAANEKIKTATRVSDLPRALQNYFVDDTFLQRLQKGEFTPMENLK